MGRLHDDLTTQCGDQILTKIRSADSQFKQVFSTSVTRDSDWGWPRPDYVLYDAVNKCKYAIEFKPTNQTKREYLCGLGQALAYLQKHMYSGLIVPTVADDGYKIADFIKDTMKAPEFKDVPFSLFEYDPKTLNVKIIKKITKKRTAKKLIVPTAKTDTFWCWWRDASNYEVYDLLSLSFKYADKPGDIYTTYIYPEF